MKSTYAHKQVFFPKKTDAIITQSNYDSLRLSVHYAWELHEVLNPSMQPLIFDSTTVAVFRFKPKAKPIDLGELA